MSGETSYWIVFAITLASALIVFPILFNIAAPYGRYSRRGWGFQLPSWLGWLLMESVSALVMLIMFVRGNAAKTDAHFTFLLMWEAHYIHRALIYPFWLRDRWRPMPVVVPLLGATFNLANAYLNGFFLFELAGSRYAPSWLESPQFVAGAMLFVGGFIINRHADQVLHNLRAAGDLGYKIPYGGLYRYISCPNYLGEILEWTGWAVATLSWPGLLFAVWTFANLAPRARAHHKWYHENFEKYPAERKALLPGLW